MADDSGGQAIEIIGALQEAGVLRAARTTSEPAAQIIAALSEAGLLATPHTASEPAAPGRALAPAVSVAPAEPEPNVGDEAYLGDVRRITTSLLSGSGQVVLSNNSPPRWKGDYFIDFPPNSKDWIPEIDRIVAAPRQGTYVEAAVKITSVSRPGVYVGKLTLLRAQFPLG
ncbi:MAG TPA: hypothetical protein VH760_09330 [Gaiellaceae bacterium]|jgi:hypothetical protein